MNEGEEAQQGGGGDVPVLPRRRRDSHKGDYGRVLIVAGSPGMPGAALLATRSALRSGAGLVTALIPPSLSTALAVGCPEATQLLTPAPQAPGFEAEVARLLEDSLAHFDAVALGPGLGTSGPARFLVRQVLERFSGPHVVDADALNVVADPATLAGLEPACGRIWTPHPGEFFRLSGEKPTGDGARRDAAQRFAEAHGGTVVLKGHRTVVTDGERVFVNTSGNPGMATGGAGDVLTGVLAALLAQGLETFRAAALGVYVHGRAGDLAAETCGETSLIAGDLIATLPQAFAEQIAPT